ncbi:hypothetical protein LXA43DRAFT_977289 [Ganoderma leucocontextum]|nr:hypothetical protein LXA43DRAFT_977289 [Ganoderma leucocontextum]
MLTVETVSNDLRRLYQHALPIPPSASQSPVPLPSGTLPAIGTSDSHGGDSFFLPDEGWSTTGVDASTQREGEQAPRYETLRQFFLDKMLQREGRGDFLKGHPLSCHACTVRDHANLPFHRIKVSHFAHYAPYCASGMIQHWNGVTFEKTNLKAIGLSVQLGHQHDGAPCSNPIPVRDNFTVLHVNGHHPLRVSMCGCDQAARVGSQIQQLLRGDLWPTTDAELNTCFSFVLLEHYHIMSLQGKISMYDYYQSLERMMDNTGTIKILDRYRAFMRVVAHWTWTRPLGVAGTKLGELAIRCLACPQPNVNLPAGWDKVAADEKFRFLYTINVAIDVCFCLKCRNVSDKQRDPILGSGWGYFVEDTGYKDILAQYGDQEDISTCTGLSAIDHANMKYSKGYAATGVGAVMCARHEFWLPRVMGDLQKGERYVNMDYVFACAMQDFLTLNKLVSYDIACQWWKGLQDHLAEFPPHLRIPVPDSSISYVVPKLHYTSHKPEGHSPFSLNFRLGSGRLDGEGIEHRWCTRVMGPGARQGVLEDQLNYSNWRKMVELPTTLRNRLRIAYKTHIEQLQVFTELTASLLPENIAKWRAVIQAWEKDPFNQDDPYVISSQVLTEAETLRVLWHEEQQVSATPGFIALHEVSVLGFVTMGLELEAHQVRLQADVKDATPGKATEILECRMAMHRKIQKFWEVLKVYMPGAAAIIDQDINCRTTIEDIENVRLALPSAISPGHRAAELKVRLCEAQCRDTLQDIRNKLHTIDHLYRYKKLHVRHQGPNTCACNNIANEDKCKLRAVQKYRRVCQAKLALSGPGPWESEMVDSLHVEWLKARARVMHWQEEVKLLPEEMRRVLVWLGRVSLRTDMDTTLLEGLVAYVYKRANIQCAMWGTCRATCLTVALSANGGTGVNWIDEGAPGLVVATEDDEDMPYDPHTMY